MLTVKFICVGKMKEKFYIDAFGEYQKRLGAFCRFELEEISEQRLSQDPSEKEIAAALEREAAEIEKRIPAGAAVVPLCVEGVQISSEELARRLSAWAGGGKSRICFIIGGSFGLSPRIKAMADLRLSMSKMTFPHHLARVMAAEQIYRAFTMIENTRYHK